MKIKEFRSKLKYTQQSLAQALNVTQAAVAMWENGKAIPHPKKLKQMAELFGCSVDELLETEKAV